MFLRNGGAFVQVTPSLYLKDGWNYDLCTPFLWPTFLGTCPLGIHVVFMGASAGILYRRTLPLGHR